jgi:hypothetical protein
MISEAGLSFNLIQTGKDSKDMRWGLEPWVLGGDSLGKPVVCPLERQNHARELVQGLNLSEWDSIVTVSGDGLLYEVAREYPAPNPEPGD